MSKNLKLKKIAIVAISALGFGVFSVMPAKAASLSSVTLGNLTSATVAARSSTQVTFSATTDDAASGDAIVYSLAVTTKPAASSLAVANPNTTAAASAKVAFRTGVAGTEASVTDWALTTVGATRKDTSSGTTAISAANRGVISITPDAAGVYVITLSATATPNGGSALTAVTKTWTVTATAVNNTSLLADTLNLKRYTASPKTDSETKVNLGLKMTAGVTPTLGDGTSFTAYLSSYPSGGFKQVTASTSCSDGTTSATYPTALGGAASATGATLTLGATAVATDATAITASSTACTGSFSFTPNKAGDHTLTVWADSDIDGAIDIGEAVQTLVITVVEKAGYSNSLSTAFIIAGNGTTRATAATDEDGYVFASKTMSTSNSAAIAVAVVDSTGTVMTSGNTLTATITGVGGVVASAANQAATQCNASTVTRVSSVTSDGEDVVYVCADGNAGVGTVTIQVTNAAGTTTTLATKTVTFYGAVTAISTTSSPRTIGRAGGYTAGAADASLASRDGTNSTTPAFVVKTVDATGGVANIASAGVPEIVSSDLTVVTGGTCVLETWTIYASGLGAGFYNCNFDTAITSASGQKATLTVRTPNPAVANAYLTTTVNVTIGGSASTHTLTFNKSAYEPGEAMVMTWKAVDSAGNPVYDGLATPEISFNKAIGGSSQTVAASVYVGGTYSTSSTRPTIFAPSVAGEFLARASGVVAGVTSQILVPATVSANSATDKAIAAAQASADAAADAAAEAIDAANAATDAANLSAEAADAATVAAEEARDAADAATAAVEALATEVATLMAALKAQITTLANTVAKIAKKVKA